MLIYGEMVGYNAGTFELDTDKGIVVFDREPIASPVYCRPYEWPTNWPPMLLQINVIEPLEMLTYAVHSTMLYAHRPPQR